MCAKTTPSGYLTSVLFKTSKVLKTFTEMWHNMAWKGGAQQRWDPVSNAGNQENVRMHSRIELKRIESSKLGIIFKIIESSCKPNTTRSP